VERRELFASLAHQLRIPLVELERAVAARAVGAPVPAMATEEIPRMEVDDLLRPVLRLCWEPSFRAQLENIPPAWWESLQGAPLLQCVLDSDGAPDHMPSEVLAHLRRLEASWAAKDDAELEASQIILRMEVAYVEREKQAVNRQLQDPAVMADPQALRRLEVKAAELLQRAQHLRKQLVGQRQRN
jgi:DNA primase